MDRDGDLRLDLDEHDTPDEVDAAFRTLRRVAIWHFALFGVAVLGVPALSLTLGWWSDARIEGGMSPGFAMAAFGLYAFFLATGLAAATLSSAVEARMLGGAHEDHVGPGEHAYTGDLRDDGPRPAAGETRGPASPAGNDAGRDDPGDGP